MNGGSVTPSNPLPDGKYKFNTSTSGPYVAMSAINGVVEVYAQSLEEGSNINIYQANGTFLAGNGGAQILGNIAEILGVYDNFVRCERVVQTGNIADFDTYESIN